jgi:hypothetical protein
MNFLHEWGFDIKEGQTQAFQEWMKGNEEKLALEMPEGCKYFGTYAAVYNSDKTSGSFRVLTEMDSYAAQDRFSEVMKEGGAFARLMGEFTEFMDQGNQSNWSQALMRRITDTAIWGE